jgi:hypothetical protein
VRDAAIKHTPFQGAHVVRREGKRPLDTHLDAGPAIVVVARGDHGDAFDAKLELREIGHRRQRQADVVNLGATGDQAVDECGLDRGGIDR